jgi:hypothetical protein
MQMIHGTSFTLEIILLIFGVLAFYFGIIQGEWWETMFNANLL